ncbi:uncharacterized protein LOC113978247 [Neopelma chrysocephalum]|uniref:uncharacterized protein LOC113978247 n=1 Tax=Neopelma chrysocephalum TaxID=114329 RepID=UPI000FCCE2C6|nr:uncharacterized protein LOC113978247 [Neopelma chrysocephalum]
MALRVQESLVEVEVLCNHVSGGTDPAQQTQAEKVLPEFVDSPECLSQPGCCGNKARVTSIKYWGRCEPMISRTLQFPNDLSVGYPFYWIWHNVLFENNKFLKGVLISTYFYQQKRNCITSCLWSSVPFLIFLKSIPLMSSTILRTGLILLAAEKRIGSTWRMSQLRGSTSLSWMSVRIRASVTRGAGQCSTLAHSASPGLRSPEVPGMSVRSLCGSLGA